MLGKWRSLIEQVRQRSRAWTAAGARLLYPPSCLICGNEHLGQTPTQNSATGLGTAEDSKIPQAGHFA